MKEFRLLIWLTQLGLSAAVPLAGFTFLGIWLHKSLGWGKWALIAGIVLGLLSGGRSLWDSLKAMERMAGGSKKEDPPPVSFNDHK